MCTNLVGCLSNHNSEGIGIIVAIRFSVSYSHFSKSLLEFSNILGEYYPRYIHPNYFSSRPSPSAMHSSFSSSCSLCCAASNNKGLDDPYHCETAAANVLHGGSDNDRRIDAVRGRVDIGHIIS